MTDDTITVYADYACPFCYLGRSSLAQLRENREEPLAVEWHPFDLRADRRDESGTLTGEMDPDDPRYQQAWRNVERLADEYDVAVPDGPITGIDSLPAQQVSSVVQEHHPEAWAAFDAAVYDALWTDERDIADPSVLEAVAVEANLDPAVVDRALGDADRRARLDEQFDAARERGVTGVPTFVVDDRVARGAVSPAKLGQLVDGSN